jgi:O-antigen ligase
MAKDLTSPIREGVEGRWPLTGLGLGSFYYTFHIRHHNSFFQAHNEYFEFLYNCGIGGLFLLLAAIWQMIKKGWNNKYLLASFICVLIIAGGTFIFQLGAPMYYSVVIIGLLYHQKENNDVIHNN